jgi:hypothetical protein
MPRQLEALALLHRVWGTLGLITALALFVLAGGTLGALTRLGLGRDHDAPVWLLAGLGVLLGGFAAGALAAARGLRRRHKGGRVLALVCAIPNLVVVPFGTALGAYTFWVLLNDDARREFGRPLRGPAALDSAG